MHFFLHFQSLNLSGHATYQQLFVFKEVVKQLIGVSVENLYEYEYEGNTKKIIDIFRKLFFHNYLFKLVVHEETFSNKKQIKSIVIACDKIDCISKTKEDISVR